MKKIAILQRVIPHYRKEFYKALVGFIETEKNISLDVFYGNQKKEEALKELPMKIKGFHKVKNYYLFNNLYYQPIFRKVKNYDYIILEQAISPLINWLIISSRIMRRKKFPKIILWGHGKQFIKINEHILFIKLREYLTKNADWFFGYTSISKNVLVEAGFNAEKITVINNSMYFNILENNNITKNRFENYTIVYCGRLNKSKKLDLIIESVKLALGENEQIKLKIVGDGPEKKRLEKKYNDNWIQFLGHKYGKEKREILSNCSLQIIPSHIGLSILDGFASGLPIITANFKNHCPEVAYFKNNYNGIMSDKNSESIAKSITYIFSNFNVWKNMSVNSTNTAKKYDVISMARKFYKGLINATK